MPVFFTVSLVKILLAVDAWWQENFGSVFAKSVLKNLKLYSKNAFYFHLLSLALYYAKNLFNL